MKLLVLFYIYKNTYFPDIKTSSHVFSTFVITDVQFFTSNVLTYKFKYITIKFTFFYYIFFCATGNQLLEFFSWKHFLYKSIFFTGNSRNQTAGEMSHWRLTRNGNNYGRIHFCWLQLKLNTGLHLCLVTLNKFIHFI